MTTTFINDTGRDFHSKHTNHVKGISSRREIIKGREGFFKNAKLFPIGDDEETCPSSCNLEEGDSCLWTNDVDNDMDWTIGQTDVPPYDHTKGDYSGHFLHLKGNVS